MAQLRRPDRDTILYPALAYPTYEMGAILAGCRAVPVAVDDQWHPDLSSISDDDAGRALALWVNSPGNPAGQVDDLAAAAAWGRAHACRCSATSATSSSPGRARGARSSSTGSTAWWPCTRCRSARTWPVPGAGFYAGDPDLVHYLSEVRKHVGMMVAGPVQAAGIAALGDDAHVDEQRRRYLGRLERCREILAGVGVFAPLPGRVVLPVGPRPDGDAPGLVDRLAADGGALVAPGDIFGPAPAWRRPPGV